MNKGKLEIIFGPMYAGKSTYMLHELSRYHKGPNKKVMVVVSKKDTREFLTHNSNIQINLNNKSVDNLSELYDTELYKESEIIGIDESQFFTDLMDFYHTSVEKDHKHIIVSGLAQDFQRNKFGSILDLIPFADKLVKLSALCKCGNEAIFSKRIVNNDSQILIGASEAYVPVCREHYLYNN